MDGNNRVYNKILLKISGEVLAGDKGFGIEHSALEHVAHEIKQALTLGVKIAVVIGGGNIFRGISAVGIERASADYMGMLATILNALALQNILENHGVITRVQTAIEMKALAEGYARRKAIRHLEKDRVVIFAAGTGNPYFSTDTAASLRAMEIGADVILKGTKVDGVYNKDPLKHKDAVKFESLSFFDVIEKNLKVMDATAITMCMDNDLPIVVFNIKDKGNLQRVLLGEKVGTFVTRANNAERNIE